LVPEGSSSSSSVSPFFDSECAVDGDDITEDAESMNEDAESVKASKMIIDIKKLYDGGKPPYVVLEVPNKLWEKVVVVRSTRRTAKLRMSCVADLFEFIDENEGNCDFSTAIYAATENEDSRVASLVEEGPGPLSSAAISSSAEDQESGISSAVEESSLVEEGPDQPVSLPSQEGPQNQTAGNGASSQPVSSLSPDQPVSSLSQKPPQKRTAGSSTPISGFFDKAVAVISQQQTKRRRSNEAIPVLSQKTTAVLPDYSYTMINEGKEGQYAYYCVCGRKPNSNRGGMFLCDNCGRWGHLRCNGVSSKGGYCKECNN
jgi:hypothetical protein